MSPRVSMVIVSHSAALADGVAELAAAMAPDVQIYTAGGLPGGGLGTSFDLVEEAVTQAVAGSEGAGAAILTDIGSSTLTVDAVTEFADDPEQMQYAPGPLVEGAVAAAVLAQQGADLATVVAGVRQAADQWGEETGDSSSDSAASQDPADAGSADGTAEYSAVVVDADGLHARPAARLATFASEYDAEVLVNDASAESMIELMGLGVRAGDTVTVTATGPDADRAAREVAAAISTGFDEAN